MGIGYAVGNLLLAAQKFENWPEVVTAISRKQEPSKIILKDGLRIEASAGLRYLVREIFFEHIYTPVPLSIGPNDVVVDIGANCGVFTLFAACQTRNSVYAFEPAPDNFGILRHNLAINGLTHVLPHRCAISDIEGTMQLMLNVADGQQNLLRKHILPAKIAPYVQRPDMAYLTAEPIARSREMEVPTRTLRSVMDEHQLARIDFLKLDCEGAEGDIISSTPLDYLQRIRKISLEFHDHLSALHHHDLSSILREAGFDIRLHWDQKSPLGYIYAWR